ncbi:MAG: flagellar filament capping protein FliD [Lachnospiraceae bacterium]|nr:flagellar filament capping protein FliD [Lachnospiraceae bacterium]
MGIRMTGLSSGLDTESIVSELMKAKSMKKTKIEHKKTKLEWTEEKWKDLNTKLYALYTDKVSNMRLTAAYNTKKVSVSDSSVVGVSAKSNATNGSYSLQINSIATANSVTTAKLQLADGVEGSKVTSKTKISELMNGEDLVGKEISIAYKGKSVSLGVDENTTVGDYVNRLKAVGISASFDESQQRMFIMSGTSGEDSNFTINVVSGLEDGARMDLRYAVADYDALTVEEKDTIDALIYNVKNSEQGSEKYKKSVEELKAMASASGRSTNEEIDNLVNAYRESTKITDDSYKLAALGMTSIVDGEAVGTTPAGMAVIKGTDSEIVLNGATLKGSDTTMNVNGLTIDLKGRTNGSTVSFSVSNDVDAVYDSIKSFITEYNSILDEMNKLYHAKSARGYDPLTDEEKEAMTENQIELWEGKIKDSLLRSDTTLGGIIEAMKGAMMSSVEIDGKKYSLSSLGIMTSSDYTEYGKLHIYGDKEDSTYADKTDKLRALLESDPDFVTKIMTGVTGKLHEEMQKKMSKTSLSSALTFYNDKQFEKQKTDYDKSIAQWDKRLKEIEDKYYKQFTAMEKAMAQMQSSQSSLASMLGN